MTQPTVGQSVICNGYNGAITKVHTGQLAGMVDVRLERGSVCVSYSYPDCYDRSEHLARIADALRKIQAIRPFSDDDSFNEYAVQQLEQGQEVCGVRLDV